MRKRQEKVFHPAAFNGPGGGSGSYAFFLKSCDAAAFHVPGTALKLEKREKRSKPSHKAR